jgi:hypothetical protein
MRIEEQYTDVMQNLEFPVAEAYRGLPEMTDYTALRVYEAAVEVYSAERADRAPRLPRLDEIEQGLLGRIREVCEWRLGRAALGVEDDDVKPIPPGAPMPLDTLILCLKRLVKSVKTWTRRSGRQGYLKFVSPFVLGDSRYEPHADGRN